MAENGVLNESVLVEVTSDKMLGVISFSEPQNGGRKISLEQVKDELDKKGIVKGIKEEDLKELCKEHRYNYKYIIAQGKPAVEGEDGYIEFAFDTQGLKQFKPKINDDGTVDLKDLSAVKNVRKGDKLATRILANQGEDGFNVLG